MITTLAYRTDLYPFRKLFCQLQRQDNLESVHVLGGFENVGSEPGKDNNSDWHSRFYQNMKGSEFMSCYTEFMKRFIRGMFDEPIVYQRFPTLRYQIPGGKGVAAYHVDADYNHPVEEHNIWLPLTYHTEGTRSIFIESKPGKGDYSPQRLLYGQFIIFPGGKLCHGNEPNTTDQTRVSIDMRVIRLSEWKPSDKKGLAYGKVRDIEGPDAYYAIIS